MNRRCLIGLLGGAAAFPLVARAQQVGVPVVGYLGGSSPVRDEYQLRSLRQGLNEAGYIDGQNAVIDLKAKKVRGDWYLLKSHTETPRTLEKAERMPETFGLSVAFKGKGAGIKGGKKAARCERLLACDCVTQPAANPDGLFSRPDAVAGVTDPGGRSPGAGTCPATIKNPSGVTDPGYSPVS